MAMERYSVDWNEGEARGLVARKDKERHSVDWNEDGSDDPARKKQEEPVQKKKPDSVHEKQDGPVWTRRSVDGLDHKTICDITGVVALGMVLLCWIFK